MLPPESAVPWLLILSATTAAVLGAIAIACFSAVRHRVGGPVSVPLAGGVISAGFAVVAAFIAIDAIRELLGRVGEGVVILTVLLVLYLWYREQ
jgi:hypothetical protein